jgi:hypothetical protein
MLDLRGGVVFGRMFWDTAAVLDSKAVDLRGKGFSWTITRQGGIAGELAAAGLENVQETVLTIALSFSDSEDFWALLEGRDSGFAAYVSTLNVAQKDKFKCALRLAYFDGSPDGSRTYFASAWAARGE